MRSLSTTARSVCIVSQSERVRAHSKEREMLQKRYKSRSSNYALIVSAAIESIKTNWGSEHMGRGGRRTGVRSHTAGCRVTPLWALQKAEILTVMLRINR